MRNLGIRLAGSALALAAVWYGVWMLASLNLHAVWLAIPFAGANLLIIVTTCITVVNNWERSAPKPHLTVEGEEPNVAVIVPTYGEAPALVLRTVRSMLRQHWPNARMRVIISDDAHAPVMRMTAEALQREFPQALVLYHEPPRRGDPRRQGDAKAGNLNSALAFIQQQWADVAFIETRDADDEVGDRDFLRACVGQLQRDARIAYVQTIKEARVSKGDPFANLNGVFYRGSMFARHAANAVIPCGSGLVWRTAALLDIGGFPSWNLVEDLQSGIEALRRGWRGVYLPIIGAIGQTAPEDIPNVYKQSGTWALDTMRLFFWGNKRGLTLRQRLHFIELGLFYLQSVTVIIILLTLAISLFTHTYPLTTSSFAYALHFWPFALAIELFLATLNGRQRYEALLRQREMWIGLAPIFLYACFMALVSGPNRKPTYRVTRKNHQFAWYWYQTLPQSFLLALVIAALVYAFRTSSLLTTFDIGSAYWALFYGAFLIGFIRKSWYGVGRRRAPDVAEPTLTPLPVPVPVPVPVPSLSRATSDAVLDPVRIERTQ